MDTYTTERIATERRVRAEDRSLMGLFSDLWREMSTLIHDELAPPIAAAGARLVRVRVEETRRNAFTLGELR